MTVCKECDINYTRSVFSSLFGLRSYWWRQVFGTYPVTEAVSPGVGSLDITTSSSSTSGNVAEVGTGGISTVQTK